MSVQSDITLPDPTWLNDDGADSLFLSPEGIDVMRSVNWMDNMDQFDVVTIFAIVERYTIAK